MKIEEIQMDQYSTLVEKLVYASHLSQEQISDLLSDNQTLLTSKSQCILDCVEILKQAKIKKQKVFIGGDYDSDGVCATTLMKSTLDLYGIENGYYIPDRFKQGYGLSVDTVEKAHEKGYEIVITVDNGVKALDAINRAKELGMIVIVTDHHLIEHQLNCDVLVHPSQMEDDFSTLCGTGVAFEISLALLGEIPMHTALAAVASIGDMMSLFKQTRVIVKRGLKFLEQGVLPAMSALIKSKTIDKTTIGFQVVPKLNCVGRMDDSSNANTLIPFLLSKDPVQIQEYAISLNKVNDLRKQRTSQTVKVAQSLLTDDAIQVLYDESFFEGVVGLAAGRIAKQVHKPTIVFSKNEGNLKASGRSIPGFSLFDFLSEGFDEFVAFGGHSQAVGFSIPEDKLDQFCQKVKQKSSQIDFQKQEPVTKAILIDPSCLTVSQVQAVLNLDPYPNEMIEPIFCIHHPRILDVKRYEKVVKLICDGYECVYFGKNQAYFDTMPDTIYGQVSLNYFAGKTSVQLQLLVPEE